MKELELLNQISGFDVRGERLCEAVDACYGDGAWGRIITAMKDAERYRWLRDKCNHVRVGVHIQFSSDERDADAAIDAAMQGANG